ncbi:MAG: DNA polymerase III subunit alpha [Magnetococcales bacterium]|nr:DNA polymerase III subunit alpha [Magnetococcales bacterium]
MSHAGFVHLHVHSAYSLLSSTVRPDAVISRAKEWKMPALAITDQGNLFAAVKFYKGCLAAGIKPILGAQIYLVEDHTDKSARVDQEPRDQLILLTRNADGWRSLMRILSEGHLVGSHGKPRIDQATLKKNTAGLIALSAGEKGGVGKCLLKGDIEAATKEAQRLKELFADENEAPNFFLELQRTFQPDEESLIQATVHLAHALDIPLVASNDVHFLDKEDHRPYDALHCVGAGNTLYEENRHHMSDECRFHHPDEMIKRFADLPEAVENTVMIAQRCNFELPLGHSMLPDYQVPEGEDLSSWLRKESQKGLEKRLTQLVLPRFKPEEHQAVRDDYQKQLEYELDVILQMGFPGYFLIVSDFIRWAKDQKIPVGPGRGSGAGSLVAWSLDITDLDPKRYQLLFERFLNPERVSMPDFDVDFCMDRREEVIHYVQEKYGAGHVAQIITFGRMQAKAVVRDVGRVLEFPYGRVDKIAKLIPNVLGINLTKALDQEERLVKLTEDEPEIKELMDLALALEGMPRSAGTHAAGVVISDGPLTDTVPLYRDPGSEMPVTQFNMGDVEQAGLVKFDFLGLKTLTVIDQALSIVNANREQAGESAIDINLIDLEDKPTFDLLKEGRTLGVFQLESSGMREILKKLAPDVFEDIIALVALYRPGPLGSGMVDDFIDRKHGRTEVEYPLPQLEPILNETYGVILYQEQVMKIAQVLAEYSLGGADLLRRAMGKKKPEEMAKQRGIFMDGAKKQKIDLKKAEYIFDLMEKFAGYGFNKSHSAAYALISYQTAWLKAHYPKEFMAAVLTCDMLNTEKVMRFIRECKFMKIPVRPPDVNFSEVVFSVEDDAIRYGMAAVKSVGENAVQAIVDARKKKGKFSSLFDLCRRTESGNLNRRVMENLIKAGGMDTLHDNRAAMLATVPRAMSMGARQQKEESLGFLDLFSDLNEEESAPIEQESLEVAPEFTESEKLNAEKDALGFFITGHPMQVYERELDEYGVDTTESLAKRFLHATSPIQAKKNKDGKYLIITAGIIVARKILRTKKGDRMAFVTLEDRFGQLECVVFPEPFLEGRALLEEDDPVVVEASVEPGDEDIKLMVDRFHSLDSFRARLCKVIRITLDAVTLSNAIMDELDKVLTRHKGGTCRVIMEIQVGKLSATVGLGDAFRVFPQQRLFDNLTGMFGPKAVAFSGL